MDKQQKRINRNDLLKNKDRGDRKSLNDDEIRKLPSAPDSGDLNKPANRRKIGPQKETENTELSQCTNTEELKAKRKVKPKNLEFRQRVRDRYTLVPKGILKIQRRTEGEVCYVRDDLSPKEYFCKESSELKTSPETKSERSAKLRTLARWKPVAKTSKHARIPKAVTFEDARPLEVRATRVKQLITPRKEARRVYITNKVPDKCEKHLRNRDNRVQLPSSPEMSQVAIVSPPTEVAQWTPTTAEHTMPYYEAWVDTTLAAISKLSKKDKANISKQKVMQSFQSELQRTWSPELLYRNINDEKYTGKIRIRQK